MLRSVSEVRMFVSGRFRFSSIRTFSCATPRFLMSSASCMSENKYLGRQAKMLNKLMSSSKKKRKNFIFETPTSGTSLSLGKEYRGNKENSRRMAVLNKLFMKHISDQLMTGSFSETVLDKGLELTRVAVAPDFKHVNVFWTSNDEKNLTALEVILPNLGFTLRHELSQLRVMGVVPRIVFVKDRHLENALKVDALLKIADYGEDHEASDIESDFKRTQEPQLGTNQREDNNVNNDERSGTEGQLSSVELLPVMRQDTFNLDHHRIMNKIMKSMHKSRALHRYEPNLAIAGEGTTLSSTDNSINMSKKERKEAISKFILQRRLKKESLNQNKNISELNVALPFAMVGDVENDISYDDFKVEDFLDEDDFEDEKYNK